MRLNDYFVSITQFVCQVLLVVLVGSVFTDVVMRYGFGKGFLAAGEFVPYLFTWLVFLGSSLAVREKGHLAVDIVLISVGARTRQILETMIFALSLAFFLTITYYGWSMTLQTMVQRTPYLELPYGYIYLSVPISGFLMSCYTLENLWFSLKELFSGSSQIATEA